MPTVCGMLALLVRRTAFWWASEYLDPSYYSKCVEAVGWVEVFPRPTIQRNQFQPERVTEFGCAHYAACWRLW